MIFVERKQEPPDFDQRVRRPGRRFLRNTPRPTSREFPGMPTGAVSREICTMRTMVSVHTPATGLHVIPVGARSNTLFPSPRNRLWHTSGTTFDLFVEE